jgi:hypothetical protein
MARSRNHDVANYGATGARPGGQPSTTAQTTFPLEFSGA